MRKTFFFTLSFMLFVLLQTAGCKQKSRFAINLNDQAVKVKINRFDRDVISLDTANMYSDVQNLYRKYPGFFPAYAANVIGTDPADTTQVAGFISDFLSDTAFVPVNQAVLDKYAQVDDLEQAVSTAYTYMHHYFPEINLPEVYFFVSGFNLSILMTDKVIGMGTDMYLGTDFPAYQELTYQYMVNNMKRENIITDMISAFLFREFGMDSDKDRLLDQMLYRGKVMFLLSVCMPNEKDEYLIGYTSEQLDWCRTYERDMWASVIDQKHLFSSDVFLIRKYLNDAPFTSTVSQDSPGRAGTWLGWQIIRSYMQKNTNVSLQELMRENDYQKILEESGYRP